MSMIETSTERLGQLRQFQAALRLVDPKDDREFQRVLQEAQQLLEMSDQEIGDAISVSRPTVNRWVNGRNLPYNAMRSPVFTWIDTQLARKIKMLTSSTRSVCASPAESYAYPIAAKHR